LLQNEEFEEELLNIDDYIKLLKDKNAEFLDIAEISIHIILIWIEKDMD